MSPRSRPPLAAAATVVKGVETQAWNWVELGSNWVCVCIAQALIGLVRASASKG